MKLKHTLLLLGLTALSFTACNEYDEGNRWDDPVPSVPKKNVLIEDFTGQWCSNCVGAATTAHNLQATYGADTVVVVALHGGPQSADVTSDEQGLANETSKAYNAKFMGNNGYPMGSVDRGALCKHDQWAKAVVTRMTQEPKVDINMTNADMAYDTNNQQLSLKVSVKGNANVEGKLQVWLIEDHVTAYQLSPTTYIPDYEHNHVFRATLNGMEGDELNITTGQTAEKTYTYTLPDFSVWMNTTPWNVQNLSVVAFFYNAQDGVMQVISHKMINK